MEDVRKQALLKERERGMRGRTGKVIIIFAVAILAACVLSDCFSETPRENHSVREPSTEPEGMIILERGGAGELIFFGEENR